MNNLYLITFHIHIQILSYEKVYQQQIQAKVNEVHEV